MKITYRPEIDGLRAIAVCAVILYHSQITIFGHQPFKGGFIGVDIFFVISGYLITSIILKELITTGSFSFKHFYERRIRRILPALIFVMLVSLPFAWMYLLSSSFIDFSKSILYSIGFSSNYYFWYSGHQYGAESGFLKPFLHTWSLSVEEQFYILFPIVLLITFKYFRKYLIYILILGFVVSLGLADWSSRNYSSASFYFLHTRVWELLAGSILAYFEITGRGVRFKYKILNLILPSIGLFLIGHSILFFNDKMFHPSFYTLSPIIGVCLIIWSSNENELITKILSTKLFVGIGLISYSLYLWHYPIFAFARVTEFTQASLFNKLFLGIIILLVSIFSYYFIEKTFRNKKNNFYTIFKLIFSLILIILIFNIFIIIKNGKVNKTNVLLEKLISSPLHSGECKFSTNYSNFLNENFFKKDFLECKKKYNKFILILGDSHSIDLYNSISKVSKNDEFIIGLNKGGCRPLDKNIENCHYNNALKFIKDFNKNIKYIFFTHKGSYFLTNTGTGNESNSKLRKLPLNLTQINNTLNYLNTIKELNSNLIFIGPHIEPNISINYKLIKSNLDKNIKDVSNYDLIEVDEKLKELSKQNNIKYLSKINILDFKFEKDFIVNGNLTFSDTDHWSEFGEIYFGKKLVFNSILKDILFP
jgi:peptidoglycan/LPS O-acetylase OafA/YrhL